MDEKKDFSLFDREQLNIIGQLFVEILELSDPKWTLNFIKKTDDSSIYPCQVQVDFKLFETTEPTSGSRMPGGAEIPISISFQQGVNVDRALHKYYDVLSLSILDIMVNDRNYFCDFNDQYITSIEGMAMLSETLTKKFNEHLQKLIEEDEAEAQGIIEKLKAVKKEQAKD